MQIHGTNAIVTGASRGLGAALARRLAAAGARVALVARASPDLSEVVADIQRQGGTAVALPADVADKRATYAVAGAAAELLGPIDLLVHNASSLGPTPLRLLFDTECEDLEQVLAVNLVGPFRLTRALAGSMALRERGTILLVSSDAAVTPYARWGAYSASKAGFDQLGRVLAEELRPFGVRVLSVDPGEMDTAMHRLAMPEADPAELASPDAVARTILQRLVADDLTSGSRFEAQAAGAVP